MQTVSVVVPARDAAATLPALLDALGAQTLPPHQVVIVDDGSVDATPSALGRHPLRPEVVQGTGNGSYAARQLGLDVVTGEAVAFTDADCVPSPEWLAEAVALLRPDVVVGGAVRQRRRDSASVWERYDRATYLDQRELVAQGFAATANLVCLTATLRAVGGFDVGLRSSGDLELGMRLGRAGIGVVHAPDAVVVHEPRTDLRGTWALHRRLGAGWRVLAARGLTPPWWREPALRVPLGRVVELVAADGPPLRRRQLVGVHAVALTARWRGRLLG